MDGQRVMNQKVTRFGRDWQFKLQVLRSRITNDPLTEPKDLRTSVLTKPKVMGPRDVANTSIILVNILQSHPERNCFAGLEHEVISILVRRRGFSHSTRLVEVLEILWNRQPLQQGLGPCSECTF